MSGGEPHHTVVIGRPNTGELLGRLRSVSSGEDAAKAARSWILEAREGAQESSGWLSLDDFEAVCRPDETGSYAQVVLDPQLLDEADPANPLMQSLREVRGYMESDKRIYGVNTGFGSFRKHRLDPEDIAKHSANILFSHATGVGSPLAPEVVRGMMLLRVKTFCMGYSGVRPMIVAKLVEMLNAGIVPYIPEKGSVGSSGDLAPLAHLFQVMIGRGRAWLVTGGNRSHSCRDRNPLCSHIFDREGASVERCVTALEAWEAAGLQPLRESDLDLKEGLAFTNGATMSAAALALAVTDAERLYNAANTCGAISLQAVGGHTRALELAVHAVRPQIGQIKAGWELLKLLEGSSLADLCAYDGDAQDDYCLRAMPQVHGAVWNAIEHCREVAEAEINSATDNPLFFQALVGNRDGFTHRFNAGRTGGESLPSPSLLDTTHCAAANFHGEPVATALDYLKLTVAELADISERRTQMLLEARRNRGLPDNLTLGSNGLHSGYMLFQYTAAALVSENKVLAHPSSVDSIPTSANVEDHVSMATNAARHTRMVLKNVANVLAIELICGIQAVDLRTKYHQANLLRIVRRAETTEPYPDLAALVCGFVTNSGEAVAGIGAGRALMLLGTSDVGRLAGKSVEEIELPEFSLSPATERVRAWLRDDLGIPFISHDGLVGKRELKSDIGSSFREFPPAEMIVKTAQGLLDRQLPIWS